MMNLTAMALDKARQFIQLGDSGQACQWYETAAALALETGEEPAVLVEAGDYLLHNSDDYHHAYQFWIEAHKQGYERQLIMEALTFFFYQPNQEQLSQQYILNVQALGQYPYCFTKQFPQQEALSIRFYPYDERSYFPYDYQQGTFGVLYQPERAEITGHYFADLSKPILVQDCYSQYELRYLCDMVRRSEHFGGDNHLYLHYQSFENFASYLQVLDFVSLVNEEKIVFLFEEQIDQYPLDFKVRFHIDYSQMDQKEIAVEEVHKLIWHGQLWSHMGGDFFNELFDFHPNLLTYPSFLYDSLYDDLAEMAQFYKRNRHLPHFEKEYQYVLEPYGDLFPIMCQMMAPIAYPTSKDWLVAFYLAVAKATGQNIMGRIVPAVWYQPHFPNIMTQLTNQDDKMVVSNDSYETIKNDTAVMGFKYIKTFFPLRRFTTSLGGAMRFGYNMGMGGDSGNVPSQPEEMTGAQLLNKFNHLITNQSLYVDKGHRLFTDSRVVRFEDAKLNVEATLTALCRFLDIPWDDSLLNCTVYGQNRVYNVYGSVTNGFELTPVYNTYSDFVGEQEQYLVEYFKQKEMAFYGYQPLIYDGNSLHQAELLERLQQPMPLVERKQWELIEKIIAQTPLGQVYQQVNQDKTLEQLIDGELQRLLSQDQAEKVQLAQWCNPEQIRITSGGQWLQLIDWLKPAEERLVQPLYQ